MASISLGNSRLIIYSNDHPPPHVHVVGPGWEFRIALSQPPSLLTLGGKYKKQDVAWALAKAALHLPKLKHLWRQLHG